MSKQRLERPAQWIDRDLLQHSADRISSDIEIGRYDGARLIVAHGNSTLIDVACGFANREAGSPMKMDSVFSVMSISKVMTAIAVMQQVERGNISLLTPVAEVLPEFAQFGKGLVTVGQILTHTAGMGMGTAPLPVDRLGNLQDCALAICGLPLESAPGEQVSYSASMGYTILGEVVRRVDGGTVPFRDILARDIFRPLGMHDTAIGLPLRLENRRAPVVIRDPDAPELNSKFLVARDAACHAETELPSGGGTFSTASDILRFAQALRQDGALDDQRILSPATVQLMKQNHTGQRPNSMMNSSRTLHGLNAFPAFLGLGLFLRGAGIFPSHMPTLASPNTFGGWGLGSMAFWVDPDRDVTFVMLTTGLMERIRSLLRFQRVGDMVLSSLFNESNSGMS